jgi:hypothetical protein
MLGRDAKALEEGGLAKMSTVMLTTQTTTIHTVRAMAAVADLGVLPRVRQLSRLIAGQNRADHIDSARRAARRR